MTTTHIEWTDVVWNPTTGCDRVSSGCDNCYALTMAKRLKGMEQARIDKRTLDPADAKYQTDGDPRTSGPGFGPAMHPDALELPLGWRKPRKVFVNSMSDLFHPKFTDEFIAQVFAVMAATPRHTYQVLTKRPARMRALLNRFLTDGLVSAVSWDMGQGVLLDEQWPLKNVWLGVSVENQEQADQRIPLLLDTPAAVRWISAEPLLGPVDLTSWMPPISPMDPARAPRTWAEWTWPEWVPAGIRGPVEEFWLERWGRGPHSWMRDMHEQDAPAFGATVTLDDGFGRNPAKTTGRFVHAWNNIGRIVHDDRTFSYTSFGPREVRANQRLNWVVVGGESGSGARPMHPAWARSLRDQCADADVPFLFKQLGAWTSYVRLGNPDGTGRDPWAERDPDAYVNERDGRVADEATTIAQGGSWMGVYRVGKEAAGRVLDGRTWDEYPQIGS